MGATVTRQASPPSLAVYVSQSGGLPVLEGVTGAPFFRVFFEPFYCLVLKNVKFLSPNSSPCLSVSPLSKPFAAAVPDKATSLCIAAMAVVARLAILFLPSAINAGKLRP